MELQQHLPEFEAAGVRILGFSPDPVRRIKRFADDAGITIPMLADEDSAVIKRYGILNTLLDPDEDLYGMPFPGTYLVDEDGTVLAKHFNQHYRTRETAAALLRGNLDAPFDDSGFPAARSPADSHPSGSW